MPTVNDAIRQARVAGRLTDALWREVLQPALAPLPPVAGAAERELVALFSDSRFEMEPEARRQLRDHLLAHGYPVPEARPAGLPDAELAGRIVAGNVGETDRAFAAASKLLGREGAKGVVCVADCGFDVFHAGLGPKVHLNRQEWPPDGKDSDGDDCGRVDDFCGWDYVDWDNDLRHPQGDWHGTWCAGLATAGSRQVEAEPVRVLSPPNTDYARAAWAIEQAIVHKGATEVSMSFGVYTSKDVQAFKEMMARHPDVLFVLAAGNDGKPMDGYDAAQFLASNRLPNLLVANACDDGGARAGFSNYGPECALAAPGCDVLSTIPDDRYGTISGTSAAAPTIAGTASKCRLLDPKLDAAALRKLLIGTAEKRDDWKGLNEAGGLLDAPRAYQTAQLTALLRQGLSAEGASAKLGLSRDEKARLLPLAAELVAAS